MISVGVFLSDSSMFLHEFRRKLRKTQNGYVDKSDRGFNSASPVSQLWVQKRSTTGGALSVGNPWYLQLWKKAIMKKKIISSWCFMLFLLISEFIQFFQYVSFIYLFIYLNHASRDIINNNMLLFCNENCLCSFKHKRFQYLRF